MEIPTETTFNTDKMLVNPRFSLTFIACVITLVFQQQQRRTKKNACSYSS